MALLVSSGTAPVVAILTYRDNTRVFRGNRDNFIDLLRMAREQGVTAYIATCDDFDLSKRTIKGYTYNDAKKKWVRGSQPFPNVVYNRIPYRKFEQLPEVHQIIQECLRHPDIHFFNPSFFSKWNLFEWLKDSPATRKHIPETMKLSGLSDLTRMIRNHKIVYLKPVKGKAGRGIMKILRRTKRNGSMYYRLSYQSQKNTETASFDTVSSLYDAVREHMGSKEYIAQQGIRLASHGGRPFDLRTLVQKNAKGEWRVSGIGARLAGASSITTHVPRGGSIEDPKRLLSAVFGAASGSSILKDAKNTALALASQIEKASGFSLGEMSMDLGVDTEGKLWFFEANSKPMKFDEPPIRKVSLRRLVLYWKYLVNQPSGRIGVQSLRRAAPRVNGRLKRRKRS